MQGRAEAVAPLGGKSLSFPGVRPVAPAGPVRSMPRDRPQRYSAGAMKCAPADFDGAGFDAAHRSPRTQASVLSESWSAFLASAAVSSGEDVMSPEVEGFAVSPIHGPRKFLNESEAVESSPSRTCSGAGPAR